MNNGKKYVRISAVFDKEGFVRPTAVLWSDGRVFLIDKVLDIKHMHSSKAGGDGDCFTIRIGGQVRKLFYERSKELEGNHVGRWYIECD